MELTPDQTAQLAKLAARLETDVRHLLALDDEVLALVLREHEFFDDEWWGPEGDPEPDFPFSLVALTPHPRTREPFAVQGAYAAKVVPLKANTEDTIAVEFSAEPLFVGGKVLMNDYRTAAYITQFRPKKGGPKVKALTFVDCGWLRADELNMSNEEVGQRIVDEIDAGTLTILPQRG
jgi:hypothetical protein